MSPVWQSLLPWDIIHKHADACGLDSHLIAAIVMTESSGKPDSKRFEPHWKYFKNLELYVDEFQDEQTKQATSWGLCQVMGAVAREFGYAGDLPDLCQPELGIKYGCLKLKSLMTHYPDKADMIAAYNAGSPRHLPNGAYTNQNYVDTVLKFFNEIEIENI